MTALVKDEPALRGLAKKYNGTVPLVALQQHFCVFSAKERPK